MGIRLRFEGIGVEEIGVIDSIAPGPAAAGTSPLVEVGQVVGQVVVRVDPRYFRPSEVETLLGDPSKASRQLGWRPRTTLPELVREMVEADYTAAQRDALVKQAGYQAYDYHE